MKKENNAIEHRDSSQLEISKHDTSFRVKTMTKP